MSVFKYIPPNKKSITKFNSYAKCYIDSTIDTQNITVYNGIYDNYKYSISDENDTANSNLELINVEYKQSIYHSINHLFYLDYMNKYYDKFGVKSINQHRSISENLTVFSIPKTLTVEGIKPNTTSITISDTTAGLVLNLVDDGNGNLIDTVKQNDLYLKLKPSIILEYSFNECFKFNDDYINGVYSHTNKIIDTSIYHNNANWENITFGKNLRGYYPTFESGSIIIPHNELLNFTIEDNFAISMVLNTTDNNKVFLTKNGQVNTTTNERVLLSNGQYSTIEITTTDETVSDVFPFQIGIENNKIYIEQSDGTTTVRTTSTTDINTGDDYHILLQKTNNNLEVIVNSTLEHSTSISGITKNITNQSNVLIGYLDTIYFNGSIDELTIYNTELKEHEYQILGTSILTNTFNYFVGNIFYDMGFIVLTSPNYQNLTDTFDYILQFNSTKKIYEHEYICEVDGGELNITVNPTIRKNASVNTDVIDDYFIDDDTFHPYVTMVGLYDDNANLLAVGKLSRPISKLNDVDMTFIVKFDL